MELFLAYIAGVLTLINPCVLPVLPIVLASALAEDRLGLLWLAAGMSLSFVVFGMVVAVFGRALGLTPDMLSRIGAVLMIGFGLVLVVPAFSARFESALAGFSARADASMAQGHGVGAGQLIGGMLLGIVWSPCIGPTLGGAISLASQGKSLFWAFLIMLFFAAGVSTLILGIGLGSKSLIRKRAAALRGIAERSKPLIGLVFIGVGLMILTRFHHVLEYWVISALPYWITEFSVRF